MAMKVGLVGTGGMANRHLEYLSKIKEVEITSLCDIKRERVEAASKKYGGKIYTDYEKMLKEEKLDALYICLPPFAHENVEILAAEKGIHLFIEKPIGLSLEKAKEKESSIRKNKIITSVGYQRRYQESTNKIQSLLKENEPGIFRGYWMGWMPGINWWKRKEMSGGQTVEQSTHIFDLARFFFGEVEKIFAAERKGLMREVENYNVEDASAVTLLFENGLIGTIHSACFLSCGKEVGMSIYFKDMIVKYNENLEIIRSKETRKISFSDDPGLLEDQIFIEAARTKDTSKIKSTYSDALKTLALTLAVNESIETGKVINMK